MNLHRMVLAAALVCVLPGCSFLKSNGENEAAAPAVTIENGVIQLSRDVLVFQSGRSVDITWSVDAGSGFRFAERGIVIEGRVLDEVIRDDNRTSVVLDPQQDEVVNCKLMRDGSAFTCTNRNTKPGVYKYTIRLTDGQREIARDPTVVNW